MMFIEGPSCSKCIEEVAINLPHALRLKRRTSFTAIFR